MPLPATLAETATTVTITLFLLVVVLSSIIIRLVITGRRRRIKQIALENQLTDISRLVPVGQTDILQIYRDAPVCIVIRKGPDLKVEFVNDAALAQNKLGRQAIEGATTSEYFRKVKTNFSEETIKNVYRTGQPYSVKAYPLRYDRNGDGQLIDVWYDIVMVPTHDNTGQIDGVATYTFDVTDLIQTNELLGKSDRRFRFIADAIPHKLWTADANGTITYYNEGWYNYTNTKTLEELFAVIWHTIHPDDLETSRILWLKAIEKHEDVEIEQRLRRYDGLYFWHLSRVCVFKDQNDEVIMLVGTSTNIHEQKIAEVAIAERENHFRVLANSNSALIWQTDEKGEPIFVNDTWRSYTGITEEKTTLNDWMNNIHPDDLENAIHDFREANKMQKPYQSKYRFKDVRTEQYRWMLDSAEPLFTPHFSGYIGSMTDITEQELAKQAIEELGRKKDEFFSIASHELKTPITTIKASLQVLQRMIEQQAGDDKTLPFVIRANKQATKLTSIVGDLLDINRIQFGRLELNRSMCLLNELVQDCIEEVKLKNPAADIRLNAGGEFLISADPARIEQVLHNLLDNAVKYSPADKPVTIIIERTSDHCKFSVKDEGIGIPLDKQSQVFDRFFRVHENSQHYSGLGLGLFICAEIIHRHNGEIGVISDAGQGATFWFTLPDFVTVKK